MWKYMISYGKTKILALLLLLLLLFACSARGFAMTTSETSQYIQIPIAQWYEWKSELTALNSDLIQCQQELTRLRRPSAELVQQLQQAEKMLKLLQEELTASKNELTLASSEAADLRTSLKKLKEQIEKERKVQRRQLWQNRFWCLLIGAGIGVAASR